MEAGGADIDAPALQSPLLWTSNFGTGVDWAYRTTPQAKAAGHVFDWPRGKVIGGSSSINVAARCLNQIDKTRDQYGTNRAILIWARASDGR
jgi:choline dehydrogenase-like flavoprotein